MHTYWQDLEFIKCDHKFRISITERAFEWYVKTGGRVTCSPPKSPKGTEKPLLQIPAAARTQIQFTHTNIQRTCALKLCLHVP